MPNPNPTNSNGAQGSGGDVQLSEEAITNLLHHDPLSDTPVTMPEATPTPAPSAAPQPGQQPGQQPPQPGAQPIPGQQPQGASEIDQLRNTVADLQRQLASRPQPTGQPPQQQQPPQWAPPAYNVNLPPQLAAALFGEDPNARIQALQALLTAHAQTVHRMVREEYMGEFDNRFNSLPQQFHGMQQARDVARSVFEDFYGTYTQFNKPELYPVVAGVSRRLQAEQPGLFLGGWNARARDAVAQEVAKLLQWQLGEQPAPQVPPSGGKPPRTMPTGARPSAAVPQGQQKHIADMFD